MGARSVAVSGVPVEGKGTLCEGKGQQGWDRGGGAGDPSLAGLVWA